MRWRAVSRPASERSAGRPTITRPRTGRCCPRLERGESTASALLGGYHLAWAIGLGLAIAGILLAVVLLRPQSAPQEQEAGLGAAQPAYSEE
jgi:hypothetical protein